MRKRRSSADPAESSRGRNPTAAPPPARKKAPGPPPRSKREPEIVSLDVERARRFLSLLAEDPFIALVVAEDGEIQIFAKGIEPDHMDRIRTVLQEIREGS